MVNDLNGTLFKEKIFDFTMKGNAPLLIKKNTIIEFWESWCPHCQAMIPRYEKLSEDFPQIDCYRVELDDNPELGKLFDIESFPVFLFIDMNGKITKSVGEVPEAELEKMTEQYFKINK